MAKSIVKRTSLLATFSLLLTMGGVAGADAAATAADSLSSSIPTVSGVAEVGKPLTANAGTWGPGSVSFTYQWQVSGNAVSGATFSTFTPRSVDVGGTITVTVTGSESGYPALDSTSAPTDVVSTNLTVGRLSGADRYATANAIGQQGFPTHADTVFITTGTNYPDALSAAPAAISRDAPLLLTSPTSLPSSVRDEIIQLEPTTIVILGGTSTISSTVQASMSTLAPKVIRLAGADRYATSKEIANFAFGASGADTAYIATGTNFPDALSSGSAAGFVDGPVILVNGSASSVSQQTSSLIHDLSVSTIKISGGTASVSAGVQQSLSSNAVDTARLAGADRFETSLAVNRDAYSASSTAYLASGLNFPDALAGAVLAGKNKSPLFVVPATCVPQNVLDQFDQLGVTKVVILGGTASLGSAVSQLVSCAALPPTAFSSKSAAPAPTMSTGSMPVGNLPGWRQTAAQDFTMPAALGQVGTVYGADMRGYSGFSDTSGHGTYTPDSVLSVSGGVLDYYLHTAGGKPLVATPIPFGYTGQTYGRYSVRFRSDSLPGYKIAFLLWPVSNNWNEGEVDWPEGSLNGKMSPASAIKGTLSSQWMMSFDAVSPRSWSPTDSSGWHTATTEWTPGKVKWFWDGVLVAQTTNAAGVPTTNFRWTLQAETELGDTVPAVGTAGHLQVDWAVQYAYSPST